MIWWFETRNLLLGILITVSINNRRSLNNSSALFKLVPLYKNFWSTWKISKFVNGIFSIDLPNQDAPFVRQILLGFCGILCNQSVYLTAVQWVVCACVCVPFAQSVLILKINIYRWLTCCFDPNHKTLIPNATEKKMPEPSTCCGFVCSFVIYAYSATLWMSHPSAVSSIYARFSKYYVICTFCSHYRITQRCVIFSIVSIR